MFNAVCSGPHGSERLLLLVNEDAVCQHLAFILENTLSDSLLLNASAFLVKALWEVREAEASTGLVALAHAAFSVVAEKTGWKDPPEPARYESRASV